MGARRYQLLQSVLRRRQPDLTVLLDGVHKPHNLSAVIRSCDAVGVLEAHVVPRPGTHLEVLNGTSQGAGKWVPLNQHRSFDAAFSGLKEQGFQVYAAHLSDQAVDYREHDYTQPTAFVMGTEKFGISEEVARKVDGHVIIPMSGMVESLNVSVATALLLFEAQRQRREAGMYDRCRLPEKQYQRLIFEWVQPKMAQFYRQRGEPYPELDEDGDIRGAPD